MVSDNPLQMFDEAPKSVVPDEFIRDAEIQRIVFQHAAIAILLLKDGRIVDCNTKAEELFGFSWSSIIGHSPIDFSPRYQPDGLLSRDKMNAIFETSHPFGVPFKYEWVYENSAKEQFISNVSINTFYIYNEQLIIQFLSDITDYKRNIAELNMYRSDLEGLVAERNQKLIDLNQQLSLTVEELNVTNSELKLTNDELNKALVDLHREVNIRKELHDLLNANQEKFKSFIDQSVEGISIIDMDSNIVEWNKSLVAISGLSSDDAIGRKVYDVEYEFLPLGRKNPETYRKIKTETLKYIRSIAKQDLRTMEGEVQLASGEVKFVSAVLFPIKLSKSFLIGRLTRDVTRLKNAEKSLKEYQENLERLVDEKTSEISKLSSRYIEIFNNTSDGIAIVSSNYILLEANPALQRMLMMAAEELYSGQVFDSIPQSYHSDIRKMIGALFRNEGYGNIEIELINSNGEKIPVELSANLIDYQDEKAVLSILRDVRERRATEKLIIRTTIEAEERERSRLAADLHDDIGPLLASLKMYVSVLQQRLEDTKHVEIIEVVQKLIKSSIENVRTISNNISPHLIERFGLIASVQAEIDNLKLLIPIAFSTNSVGVKFDKQIEIIIYRILKELINNTLKYAHASEVKLAINYANASICVEYADDGVGFDTARVVIDKNSGHGLANIDNRIRSINGNYTIKTSPGNGFLFILETPINVR